MPGSASIQTCPNCGAAAEAAQRFCGNCGASLRRKCPACGAENSLSFRFCSACGTALPAAAAPQAAPVVQAPAAPAARDERRWVTVIFADISGFTALSERMDPEDVKVFADQCARRMSAKVRDFDGTVLRVLGDEVLAVFGAPAAHEDDAERAVRAALALLAMDLSGDPTRPVRVHVGINSGEVLAGLMGPDENRDYTVMGDVVNTAARLRSAAPAGSVYVGELTYQATRAAVAYSELPPIAAKGKGEPVRAWAATGLLARPKARPLGTAPLIGRDSELERLETTWRRVARDRQPHLVTLLGEPGLGKSRLVAELLRRMPLPMATWHGRCLPYGEALGYAPLAAMLKEAAHVQAEDGPEQVRGRLAQLVSEALGSGDDAAQVAWHLALLSGLDLPADRASAVSPTPDQRLLHASVRRFVEDFARQTPLCLVVDDLQWADDSLLDLLESLAARLREAPVLVLGTARPELMTRRPTWGSSVRSSTLITLEALDERLEQELIAALCRERGVPPELAERIGRSAGGNPLFAEEIVAMIAEGGPAAGVPSVIKMLIAARLDALPPDERQLLQLAAVLGKIIWPGGLAALGAGSAQAVATALDALEQKDLLRPLPRSQLRGEREYSFKHDLIRDVAYEMLPRAQRRHLHALAADWLEGAAGDQADAFLDQLAHHAVEAGQRERAIGYLVRAAERAGRAAAHRQAAALLGQAIELARELGQPATVSELQAQRGLALMDVGLWEAARPELEAALAGLPPERLADRAHLMLKLSNTTLWTLDLDSMQRYAHEAVATGKAAGRRDLAAAAMICLSQADSLQGRLAESVARFEEALAYSAGAGIAYSAGNSIQGLNLYWLGRYAEAVPAAQQMIDLGRGDTTTTLESLPALGLAYAGQGRYAEAEQVFAEARRFGREFEIWPQLARAIAMSAGWRLSIGDLEGHAEVAEEARELARSASFVPPTVSAGLDLVLNYARRGDPGKAKPLWPEIDAAVARAGAWHRWLWQLRSVQARAELAVARGDWEEALHWAEASLAASRTYGRVKYEALALEARARALMAQGRKHAALDDLQRALVLAQPTGDPAMRLRAARALLDAEPDEAAAQAAREAARQIVATLPDEDTRRRFESSSLLLAVG